MTADLYKQLTTATTDACTALELLAILAVASGKGLQFADAIRQIADNLYEAQAAADEYLDGRQA